METPSSMRRVTRSQTSAVSQKNEKENDLPSSRNGESAPLVDITNDSPIIGLATVSVIEKTPSSWVVKNRVGAKQTPGSGEALLRGQVKALLQKVEEEAELANNHPSGHPTASFRVLSVLPDSSAQRLLAPTPANTPRIPNMSGLKEDGAPVVASPKLEESIDLRECLINRALLFDDSPGKSKMSDASTILSSSLPCQGSESSIHEDIIEGEEKMHNEEAEEDAYEEEEEFFQNLCEGLSKMSVQDMVRLPECTGKHTRFIYDSDDEIEGEVEVGDEKAVSPDHVLVLRGLPAPEAKHMRFLEVEED